MPGELQRKGGCALLSHARFVARGLSACWPPVVCAPPRAQIAVLANHQNGRDAHVRQIHVFGPRQEPAKAMGYPLEFTSIEFSSYLTVR